MSDAIDRQFAESLAISYGHEDHHGLYELVWGLNTSHPALPPGERLRAAQDALRSLMARGLIAIYAAEVPLEAPALVPDGEAEGIIQEREAWLPPNERPSPHYCFATTEEGERRYFAGEFQSL